MLALTASSRGQHADALRARHEDFVLAQQRLELVEEARELVHHLLRLLQPAGRQVATAAAEAHVIAHHPRAGERLEQVEDLLPLAEGIHQRRAHRAHVLQRESRRGEAWFCRRVSSAVITRMYSARSGTCRPASFSTRQRVGPVVGQRAEIIQPVRVGHRAQVGRVLADLLVVAVQVAEDRLELDHALAVEHHVHAEHAVRGGMLRPHGDFEQFADRFAGVGPSSGRMFVIGLRRRASAMVVHAFTSGG